jgi:archaellum biogenesis ATPase FlaH
MLIRASEFLTRPQPRWIVKNLLPAGELAVIYGAPGSGKTFFVLDLMAAIARGIEWQRQMVRQGSVVYICTEDDAGVRLRLKAYQQHHGVRFEDHPFYIVEDVPNLREKPSVDSQIAAIMKVGPVSVVVVDTLAASMPGGDENSGKDVGFVLDQCKEIHRKTGAIVVLVHHSGKNVKLGARGWSGINGALDVEIQVTCSGENHTALVTKQRNGRKGKTFGFRLTSINVGTDDTGETITSCVVEPTVTVKLPKGEQGLKGSVRNIIRGVVIELQTPDGALVGAVIAEAVKRLPRSPNARDQRRSNVRKTLRALCEEGILRLAGGHIFVPAAV